MQQIDDLVWSLKMIELRRRRIERQGGRLVEIEKELAALRGKLAALGFDHETFLKSF